MSRIIEKQQIVRREDLGGSILEQKVVFSSCSDIVRVDTDGQELCLPVDEWESLIDLINVALGKKNKRLHIN